MTDNNNDIINNILNQLDNEKAENAKNIEKKQDEVSSPSKPANKPRVNMNEKSPAVDMPEKLDSPSQPAASQIKRRMPTHTDNTGSQAAHGQGNVHPPFPSRGVQPQQADDFPMRNTSAVTRNNTHHKKKKKKQRSRLPGVLILTVFIFAVSICLSLVIIAFGKDVLGIGKSDSTKMIIVPEGATTEDISNLLYDEGIINSPKCFQLFAKFRDDADNFLAGEHFVSPSMAYETIFKNLTSAEEEEQKEPVSITFNEGINIFEAADKLQEAGVCNANDFIYRFNASNFGFDFESELSKTPDPRRFAEARMEGYLFPDTYTFTKDMAPEQVCQKIYYNFNAKITSDDRLKKMRDLNLTLDQLITLASIVQKEAPFRDDMNHVASVFWNRLEIPDAETAGFLQSDPTSNYSKYVIKPRLAVPNKEMTDAYDTYVSKGLPPGAISNPGLEAIDAVLQKMKTDDFYFVANIYTQETHFTKTLEEHNAMVAQVEEEERIIEAEEALRKAQEEAAAEAQNEY
ncbi:endolytic transglycosylase MltG [Ruminococcus sp.]|uniref:endolytic transglycosylase MltG n=1 Tax=Ruminococcus sp. TaxID=41978 RepID=UPI001B77601E|nr:endolytic transglycosylase MltG [Ruminococcus sp.]MBP5432846.1 endolytic transglycosylase MltG [Ruminococcus sp.]